MKREDVGLFIIIIAGLVVRFTVGNTGNNMKAMTATNVKFYDYIFLAYVPIGLAATDILLRKFKKLHFVTLSVYKIVIACLISFIIFFSASKRTAVEVLKPMDYIDWLLLIGSTLSM